MERMSPKKMKRKARLKYFPYLLVIESLAPILYEKEEGKVKFKTGS